MRSRLSKELDLLAGDIRELERHPRDATTGARETLHEAPTNRIEIVGHEDGRDCRRDRPNGCQRRLGPMHLDGSNNLIA